MTVGRVSQAAAEVLLQTPPSARLSQQTTELLLQQLPRARLGQQAVEILRSVATSSVERAAAGADSLHRGVSGSAIAKALLPRRHTIRRGTSATEVYDSYADLGPGRAGR